MIKIIVNIPLPEIVLLFFDYVTGVKNIFKREEISIDQLADNIGVCVKKYDIFGSDAEFGKRSHNAFISALKRFEEFVLKLSH